MLHYHRGPKLAIPYSMLPESAYLPGQGSWDCVQIVTITIENQLSHCSKRHQ